MMVKESDCGKNSNDRNDTNHIDNNTSSNTSNNNNSNYTNNTHCNNNNNNDDDDQYDENDFEILPVINYKNEILESVRNNQIIICVSETGSGKTTQIPQFMIDNDLFLNDSSTDNRNSNTTRTNTIAVTQPRRVAAITVAQR